MNGGRPPIEPLRTRQRVRCLSEAQLDQLQQATLQILEDVGVRFPSEKALAILAERGARVDPESQIVRFPSELVMRALKSVPRYFRLGAREASCDLQLQDGVTYFTTDGCGVETIDFDTRERRPSRKDDVARMARIADYLSSIAFYWPMVSAQDFGRTAPLHEMDAALSLPAMLILILLGAMLREIDLPLFRSNNVLVIALVIGCLSWMTVARLVRASYLTIREMDFITAARCIGAPNLRIITRHILPNAVGPIIVEATLEVGYAIMEESGLSFLGFGIQPPTPSWGNLLSDAQEHLVRHPWMAIFPGLMIFLSIIAVNYVGDGMRDAFDPFKVLKKVGEV